MGEVHRAHDPVIDRQVAIKVLPPELIVGSRSEQLLERFRREARAAGRRFHPDAYACGRPGAIEPAFGSDWRPGASVRPPLTSRCLETALTDCKILSLGDRELPARAKAQPKPRP
jgi:hypothetical protein